MGKWGQGRPEPSALVDSLNPGRRDPSFWGICRPLKAGGSMQGGAGLLPGCLCLLPLPHPVFLATWHFGTSAWGGGFLTWGLASGGEVEKVGVRIGSGRHWRCSTRLPPPSPREPGKRLCLFKSLQAAGSRWPGRPGPLVLCVALHKRGGQLGRGRLQQVGGWGLASAPQQQQAPPGKGGGPVPWNPSPLCILWVPRFTPDTLRAPVQVVTTGDMVALAIHCPPHPRAGMKRLSPPPPHSRFFFWP